MEEMNARLVAHIRALQSELRKYMDFDKVRSSFRHQFAALALWRQIDRCVALRCVATGQQAGGRAAQLAGAGAHRRKHTAQGPAEADLPRVQAARQGEGEGERCASPCRVRMRMPSVRVSSSFWFWFCRIATLNPISSCGSLGSKGASSDQEGWRDGERDRQAARHGKVHPDPSCAAIFRTWWSLVVVDVRTLNERVCVCSREFAGVLQFLVGPPIEQKVATTLQDVRVLKCSSMVKRYFPTHTHTHTHAQHNGSCGGCRHASRVLTLPLLLLSQRRADQELEEANVHPQRKYAAHLLRRRRATPATR
jgi:hypothetical protein